MIKELKSSNENVSKFIFDFKDAIGEAVLYKYPTYEERTVICCSVQCGCNVGCTFCGTGKQFVRSLSFEEIKIQVDHLISKTNVNSNDIKKLQIMFMSMGEPFSNYFVLKEALVRFNKSYPNADLLISTIAPGSSKSVKYIDFINVAREITKIGLQFSIHESTEENRNKLIPMKNKLSLKEISKLGYEFYIETGRKPFINYCVTNNNNTKEDAFRLVKLFPPNVFEYTLSVVCESNENVKSAIERQEELAREFSNKLLELGCSTRVFNPAGQDDIGGGCGQLWETQKWMRNNIK